MNDRKGPHYSVIHLGPWEGWARHTEHHHKLGELDARVFLKHRLDLTSAEVSLNWFRPGEETPVYHTHRRNEEIYLFIKGRGQFQVDGETFDVEEGSCVRVSTPGLRSWRASPDEGLYFIVIQAPTGGLDTSGFDDGVVDPATPIRW